MAIMSHCGLKGDGRTLLDKKLDLLKQVKTYQQDSAVHWAKYQVSGKEVDRNLATWLENIAKDLSKHIQRLDTEVIRLQKTPN